ncbi:hypothetical protein [Neisseria weaveri]|uniref:GAF domain-containing protein n=1 Tax=Neisseria weaveri TaxID=28091 RepID=A0A448VKA9_9NEIS|nr:hypothetical protein [Neisseria weaveri]VEJ50194.1 Uncharacterised protein [Neisseria weaveri]
MSVSLIEDYLQTQGLRLPADNVRMSLLAAQAVMNMGTASIDRNILWYENDDVVLSEYLEQTDENEALLRQIFMALDSVCSRVGMPKSAVVYALMPSENSDRQLIRLSQQNDVLEQRLLLGEQNGNCFLPVRTAQTGWLNLVDDVAYWLELGELVGGHHTRSRSQMALPICHERGAVLGVVYVEEDETGAFTEEKQTEWAGLALALAEPLCALLGYEAVEKEND